MGNINTNLVRLLKGIAIGVAVIVSAFYNYDVVVTYQAYQTTDVSNYILAFLLVIAGISIGYILTRREKKKQAKDIEI